MHLLTQRTEEIRPVVIIPDKNGIYDRLLENGVKTFTFPFRTSAYPTPLQSWKDWLLLIPRCFARLYLNTIAYYKTLSIIQKEQIDTVHTNTGVIRFGWHAATKMQIPHIWHLREYAEEIGYHHYPSNAAHLRELKQSYTICITGHIQEFYQLTDEKKSYVIYDGVLSRTQMCSITPKEKFFLYAGRLEALKGIDDLLQAYALYVSETSSPIPLWMVGTGETTYMQYIQSELKRLNIAPYVQLKGFRKDILSLLQNAYSVIIPSLTEGFGLVMAETQFAGSLAIVRDIQGLHEQLQIGLQKTGRPTALSFTSQKELSQHLHDISKQGIKEFTPIIKNGQTFASNHFSVENNIECITNLYHNIGRKAL